MTQGEEKLGTQLEKNRDSQLGQSTGSHDLETQVVKNPKAEEIQHMGALLREGKLVAIPTETVYGLGANGLDPDAMAKIYQAKGRPSDNPLILHVASQDQVPLLVKEVTPTAKKLMDTFWPGPLTITLPKSDFVPMRATGGLERVALRCPAHDTARAIIEAAGLPIAAPSANISGRPSPTTAEAVYHDMKGRIDAIVDCGPCSIGVESTVVEVGDDEVVILRPGGITEDMLAQVVSRVSYDRHLLGAKEAPKAPGMKYKHYAPDADMVTYVGSTETVAQAMVDRIDALLEAEEVNQSIKIGLLCQPAVLEAMNALWTEDAEICDGAESQGVCSCGDSNSGHACSDHSHDQEEGHCEGPHDQSLDLEQVSHDHTHEEADLEIVPITYETDVELAHSLYEALLTFNQEGCQYILAQGLPNRGLGVAIMNRMSKASGGHVIELSQEEA